jgi:glycosyltransferase involved in cell wall biosynthesis
MRLLFVADGRSPTTLSWLQYWVEEGYETHLISTYPCIPPAGLKSFHTLPVAFGGLAGGGGMGIRFGFKNQLKRILRPLRDVLGPLSLPLHRKQFRTLVQTIQPDLVHALRIPFEGMLAAATPKSIPLVVSIWGNDITLHARASFLMAGLTRRALVRADGLIADTHRDIQLGREWGLGSKKPALVVPGAGGIRFEELDAAIKRSAPLPEGIPPGLLVVNPRGQRPGSLRQDVFFKAIPFVLEKVPQAVFVCPPLKGDAEAEKLVETLGLQESTKLWPHLEQGQLWALLKQAAVFVSPSVHDGTPNSLLEAMACGCLPVVGNIESMREWVRDGVNGLLVDANSPRALAHGMIAALENQSLRDRARNENARLLAERAEYGHCMAMARAFYEQILFGR